jgi:photosystem II stability/assembly factor-like uncharacterized protein
MVRVRARQLVATVGCVSLLVACRTPPLAGTEQSPPTGPAGDSEWEPVSTPLHASSDEDKPDLWAIWGSGLDDIYAVGQAALHSTDGGSSWSTVNIPGHVAQGGIWGSSRDHVFTVGCVTCQYHTDDGGRTWTKTKGFFLSRARVWGSGPGDVWSTGSRLLVHKTANGDWEERFDLDPIPSIHTLGIWGTGPDDFYVVGFEGVIYHGTAAGTVWTRQESGTSAGLWSIWGSPDARLLVVVGARTFKEEGAIVLLSSDRGNRWTEVPVPSDDGLVDVWGNDSEIYAVGVNGTILRSSDQGRTWSNSPSGTKKRLSGVWGAEGRVFAVGGDATLLRLRR